jgi:periplasmic protein TonB
MKSKPFYYLLTPLFSTLLFASSLKAQTIADSLPAYSVGVDTTSTAKEGESTIYTKTDVKATIDLKQWRRHLESRLGAPIINAMKAGMPPGLYTVQVQFVVEKDGHISEVKAMNDPGYELGKSAVKVVQTGPRWTAAEQNGKKVRSYHTQPISFLIQPTKTIQM